MPTAASISIEETLALLDGPYSGMAEGISQGAYALWLGSGISRDRVIGLDGVLAKLLEFLRCRQTTSISCPYRAAFDKIVAMASPSPEERAQIDLAQPVTTWLCLKNLLSRLWNQYSAVLSVDIPNERLDHLLWVGLDFPKTFATQNADAEHLAIAMLALEGAVKELATANWDGLLEMAMRELGHHESFYCITVTGGDLRNPTAAANLYKFHGCALRAIASENEYRPLLIARSAQITGWSSNEAFKIVRDQLSAVIQRSRTLMIGMSAQDENIKHLFANKGWQWSTTPTPIVFSAEELGADQKNLLIVAYGEEAYESHRAAICEAARMRAYAKPLLLALLLHVLTNKLEVLASDAAASRLDRAARTAIADGLRFLRNRVAIAGNDDRIALAKMIAGILARVRHQLQNGTSSPGALPYFPIDGRPAHLMKQNISLKSSGQREAAVALGLIGIGEQQKVWVSAVDDPTEPTAGALRITSAVGTARIFFAANDDVITSLLENGAFGEADDDVVVVCSGRLTERQKRNPSGSHRTGALGPRYLAFGPLLSDVGDIVDLSDRFREEASI